VNGLPVGLPGKALALGLVALSLGALYLVVVAPLLAFYNGREAVLRDRMELADHLQATVQDLPRLREAAAQLRETASAGDLLLAGSSDAVAAGSLQSLVKELVTKGGAILSSAEILPPQRQDDFQRVGIRVSFSGDLTLLTSVLRGIETSHPILFADNLDIRGNGASATGAAGNGRSSPVLVIAFDVYGFRTL
jgi:general secretion pathway protein M